MLKQAETEGNGNRSSNSKNSTTKVRTQCEYKIQKNEILQMKNKGTQRTKKRLTQKNAPIHTVYCSFCACYSYLFIANGKILFQLFRYFLIPLVSGEMDEAFSNDSIKNS